MVRGMPKRLKVPHWMGMEDHHMPKYLPADYAALVLRISRALLTRT